MTFPASSSSTLDIFTSFRAELDEHQDRRERIIKVSRDITALSKRLIFLLHRLSPSNEKSSNEEVQAKESGILQLFEKVGPELQGENFWRYHRSISPGVEEYIEATSFAHFLLSQAVDRSMVSIEEIQTRLNQVGIPNISANDFLGGIADLTGELMRFGINSVGLTGVESSGEQVADLEMWVRAIKAWTHWYLKSLGSVRK